MSIDLSSILGNPSQGSSIDRLVSQYMSLEQRPLNDLKAKRDQLDVQKGVFNDLKSKIEGLQSAADDLAATNDSVFDSHTATSSDSSFATATALSSAANGTYVLENVVLASAQRVQSSSLSRSWTSAGAGSFTLNGTTINVSSGATLADLKYAINNATYASGKGVSATIVNVDSTHSRLILSAQNTGAANAIQMVDVTGTTLSDLGITATDGSLVAGAELQAAGDASFTVNGVWITGQSSNTISDAVSGLTLQLNKAGGPVTLTVAGDTSAMNTKITTFLDKLNSLTDYLASKSAVTQGTDGNYTRGPLNGYSLYTSLKGSLASDMSTALSGVSAGLPGRLADLGITMDSSLHFSVSDPTKLNSWLSNDTNAVANLFGGSAGVATLISKRLSPYVDVSASGAQSYLDREVDGIVSQQSSIDDREVTENERLAAKQKMYTDQFTRLQAALIQAVQMQQQIATMFSATSSLTSA
jgi:flagellar hook-associated protein 2